MGRQRLHVSGSCNSFVIPVQYREVDGGSQSFEKHPTPCGKLPFRCIWFTVTSHRRKIAEIVPKLLKWFRANARDLPWRRTFDPYAVWVSEIMLQQTQVKTVIPYFERWMKRLPSIKSLAMAKPETIHKLWEGLGYYTRVRNMQKAAQVIVARHGGKFPDTHPEVLELPGIGPYTAGAICSIAFNQATPILDGNVIRVLSRVFGISETVNSTQTKVRLWKLAEELVQTAADSKTAERGERRCGKLNESLMEMGALICRRSAPLCDLCPLKEICKARREDKIPRIPNLGKRPAASARRFAAFIVRENGSIFVRQRPAGVINAHLWEFPNVEVSASQPGADGLANPATGLIAASQIPIFTVRHSITRYRIQLDAYSSAFNGKPLKSGVWKKWRDADRLPFCSAHRKIFDWLYAAERKQRTSAAN